MVLEQIQHHQVIAVWHLVEGYLAPAFKHSAGEYSLEQLKTMLTTGVQTLVAVIGDDDKVCGAFTVAKESYPNASVAFVTSIGGRWISSQANAQLMFDWAKENGFTHIRGTAFESSARLWKRYGFNEIYKIVERKL